VTGRRRPALTIAAALVLTAGMLAPAAAAPADPDDEPTSAKAAVTLQPLAGWRIAVDPGHNGGNADAPDQIFQQVSDGRGGTKSCNTAGTQSATGYPEHQFTFEVGSALAARLERLGAEVEMTRTDDVGVGPCVDVRGRFAEDVDADLMLSIHGNGSASTSAEGFFAIVSDPAISPSQQTPSHELAQDMVDALTDSGLPPSNTVDDAISERSDLATLNFARRPAVLLELGEMRNPDEAAFMQSEDGQAQYVAGLTAGVLAWTSDREPRG
jgi:N-acetylmuramoyl-L-alanine amidase